MDIAHEREDFSNPFKVVATLRRTYKSAFVSTPRTAAHPESWPPGFDPRRNPVYVRNDIVVDAAPSEVFERIAGASDWPAYYPNSADVRVAGGARSLCHGTSFEWTTFGARQQSEVTLYQPERAIGWTARSAGLRAFHRWILEPVTGGKAHVITEECQTGITPTLTRALLNPTMHAGHQLWLDRLKAEMQKT
jgi:hypothetical protein